MTGDHWSFQNFQLYKAGNISFQDIDVDAGQAMARGGVEVGSGDDRMSFPMTFFV